MLTIGISGRKDTVVSEENVASTVGSGLVPVFATPMMISLVECAAADSVQSYLEEGQTTVGTLVNMTHVSATPLGMKVWAKTILLAIDRKRLVFEVKAYDERGLIGEGMHERFIVDKDKFLARTNSK